MTPSASRTLDSALWGFALLLLRSLCVGCTPACVTSGCRVHFYLVVVVVVNVMAAPLMLRTHSPSCGWACVFASCSSCVELCTYIRHRRLFSFFWSSSSLGRSPTLASFFSIHVLTWWFRFFASLLFVFSGWPCTSCSVVSSPCWPSFRRGPPSRCRRQGAKRPVNPPAAGQAAPYHNSAPSWR